MSSNLDSAFPLLTGAKQTMLSWVKIIESYEEIPEAYKNSCKAVLENRRPFPHLIFTPFHKGVKHDVAEKLLCEVDEVFHIWERVGGQIVSTAYPLKTISFFEVGSILLNSWLALNGLTSDGVAISSVIAFNTANTRHLAPFINALRPVPMEVDDAAWQMELAKFDHLMSPNFKFMNYARESLVRGGRVIQSILQPEIRRHIFTMFGQKIYRTTSLAHFSLLTDKEIVFIREDEQSVDKGKGKRYGGVWQYIPLRNITAVTLTDTSDDLITLSIKLAFGDQQLDKVFETSNKQEVETFQKELAHVIGRQEK